MTLHAETAGTCMPTQMWSADFFLRSFMKGAPATALYPIQSAGFSSWTVPSRRSPSACYIPLLLPRFDNRATRDKASTPIMDITDRPLTRGMRRELEKAGATPSALPQLHASPLRALRLGPCNSLCAMALYCPAFRPIYFRLGVPSLPESVATCSVPPTSEQSAAPSLWMNRRSGNLQNTRPP